MRIRSGCSVLCVAVLLSQGAEMLMGGKRQEATGLQRLGDARPGLYLSLPLHAVLSDESPSSPCGYHSPKEPTLHSHSSPQAHTLRLGALAHIEHATRAHPGPAAPLKNQAITSKLHTCAANDNTFRRAPGYPQRKWNCAPPGNPPNPCPGWPPPVFISSRSCPLSYAVRFCSSDSTSYACTDKDVAQKLRIRRAVAS